MLTLVVAVLSVLAGGFGGYTLGRMVERKAQAVLEELKKAAENVGKAVKS